MQEILASELPTPSLTHLLEIFRPTIITCSEFTTGNYYLDSSRALIVLRGLALTTDISNAASRTIQLLRLWQLLKPVPFARLRASCRKPVEASVSGCRDMNKIL